MALFARSDLMSISIPVTSGGCGATHSRPVTRGRPDKTWKLECDQGCEAYLRGDKRMKIINTIPGDKDRGIPSRLVHVADADPHWSSTPEGIPLTPDEQHIYKLRAEQGKQQLDMLTAFAALRQGGVQIPEQAQWLIDRTLEDIARPVIGGSVVCGAGHDNSSGARFCSECGIPMNGRPEIGHAEVTPLEELIPLHSLHIATLRKRCREKGLPDKGTKAQLIERLQ